MIRVALAILCMAGPAWAQAAGPTQGAIDEAVRRGTVATLAPLCGLRGEDWAFDLRRATILDTAHAPGPDDDTLRSAPGSQLVTTAMTYAETEALEDFAEAPAGVTCEPLKHDPGLARADRIVREFQELKARMKPAS